MDKDPWKIQGRFLRHLVTYRYLNRKNIVEVIMKKLSAILRERQTAGHEL